MTHPLYRISQRCSNVSFDIFELSFYRTLLEQFFQIYHVLLFKFSTLTIEHGEPSLHYIEGAIDPR